jgi:hypothetical protein
MKKFFLKRVKLFGLLEMLGLWIGSFWTPKRVISGETYRWVSNSFRKNIQYVPNGLALGCPKAMPSYTARELEDMGMVGVYKKDDCSADFSDFWSQDTY